jgi:hypothetical protein
MEGYGWDELVLLCKCLRARGFLYLSRDHLRFDETWIRACEIDACIEMTVIICNGRNAEASYAEAQGQKTNSL